MKRILLLWVVGISLQGCQADEPQVLTNPDTEPATVEFENVYKDEYAYNTSSAESFHVFNDEASWDTFTQVVNSPFDIDPETGETIRRLISIDIDFSAYTVIAAVDERHSYGGYDIAITSVIEENNEIVVIVQSTASGPGSVTAAETQPIHIVKIPKTTLPVTFEVN